MKESANQVLILTGGRIEDEFLVDQLNRKQYSLIIAADHGLAVADRLGCNLDFIVGDFDSVPKDILDKYKKKSTPIQTFPTEKDKTDTQIALELALMHNPTSIDMIGATGTRLDHVLANLHLLLLPMQLNIPAFIVDEYNRIYLKDKSFTLSKSEQYGDYVSLLPFSEQVRGLTLEGFKYPLYKVTLISGNSLGISNEIIKEEALIEFSEGTLIVIEARDTWKDKTLNHVMDRNLNEC